MAAFAAAASTWVCAPRDRRARHRGTACCWPSTTTGSTGSPTLTGAIADLTWAQVQPGRIGGVEPIPRLEDVLDAWPDLGSTSTSRPPAPSSRCARARRGGPAHRDRVCVASFYDRRRRAAVRALPVGPRRRPRSGRRAALWRWRVAAAGAARLRVPPARRGAGPPPCRCRSGPGRCAWSPRGASRGPRGRRRRCTSGPSTTRPRCTGCSTSGSTASITDRADLRRALAALARRGEWRA